MHPTLTHLLARSRERELIEQATREGLGAAKTEASAAQMAVSFTTPDDQPTLDQLAALDSHPPLAAPALIGELNHRPVAAISLRTGDVIADPFVPTTEIVQMLRLRTRQLGHEPRLRWPQAWLRRMALSGVSLHPQAKEPA